MWSRVDLVWTDVSEERIASIFTATIPEDGILHSHCCENLKSYMNIYNIYRWVKETLEYFHVLVTRRGVWIGKLDFLNIYK
jgi:hypothetical protein